MKQFPTLYTLTKTKKVQEWNVWTKGDEIHVEYGQKDGKKVKKVTIATPKNVGKANETEAAYQAELEAESKWKKQLRTGYFKSIEEAKNSIPTLPMLAADYTKVGHRITYPCHVSRKLDGLRCLALVNEETEEVELISRGGKEYHIPHIKSEILKLWKLTGITKYDGELYRHGIPLQTISSWAKKHQNETLTLDFVIFDCPSEDGWCERYLDVMECMICIKAHNLDKLKVVENYWVDSELEARVKMDEFIAEGYEGLMLRNFNGKYMWGTRNGDLQKWKDFKDLEALVIGCTEDKNEEGVLLCKFEGKEFECKMIGDHNFRKISNMRALIGKYITVKFQQFTIEGKPQFPVGICVRECDSKGNPLA